jgi:hypothetical protein
MINVANRFARYKEIENLDYYVFDLVNEDLNLIKDFNKEASFDIVFMLSIAVWISNWKEVVKFASSISPAILFETNGPEDIQQEQISFLNTTYSNVVLINEISDDDPGQKHRKLLIASN